MIAAVWSMPGCSWGPGTVFGSPILSHHPLLPGHTGFFFFWLRICQHGLHLHQNHEEGGSGYHWEVLYPAEQWLPHQQVHVQANRLHPQQKAQQQDGRLLHRMKHIQRGPVRGVFIKLQEEEEERGATYTLEVLTLDQEIKVDPETKLRPSWYWSFWPSAACPTCKSLSPVSG